MEDSRSKSFSDSKAQVADSFGFSNPNSAGHQDLRCYSASYATASSNSNGGSTAPTKSGSGDGNLKKGKSMNGWVFGDPELQRKKRVASYKAYTVEGKLKGSLRKSFRWIKERYAQVVYGRR
ncbi:unnamed protein product [Cuscuta epithymum]|nr:unnamed protein product [Cuscuta epithymum]